jgi:hypothetical protein
MNTKIIQNEKDNEDFQYNANKKITETESNLIALVSNVSEISKKLAITKEKLNILPLQHTNKWLNNDNNDNNNNKNNNNTNNINNTNNNNINNTNNINNNNNYDNNNNNNNNNNYNNNNNSINNNTNSQHISQLKNMEFNNPTNSNLDNNGKINKEIETLKRLNRDFSEKLEKLTTTNLENEKIIENLNLKIISIESLTKNSINEVIQDFKKQTEKINEENKEKIKAEQQLEIAFDQIQKIQEAMKSTTVMLHSKANKDETEKSVRIFNIEVEKLSNKIIDSTKISEIRTHEIMDNLLDVHKQIAKIGEGNTEKNSKLIMEKLNENLSNSLEKFFNENLKDKVSKLISSEEISLPIDKNLLKLIEENIKEIDLMKFEIESLKSNKDKEIQLNKLESKLALLNRKIFDLDEMIGKNKAYLDEKFKSVEGDCNFMGDMDLQNELYPKMNVFDFIKLIYNSRKNDEKELSLIKFNQENMNSQILTKVKKDLSLESGKVLEDFRNDLKISIGKIEGKLREKVDLLSLDEFGKRVDNKLNNEINKKLDKVDMKKNNNFINKKIDILENKISKTLVDTLIDLQMDDAPLILKKSQNNNGDKCASCNQYKNQNQNQNQIHNNTIYKGSECEDISHISFNNNSNNNTQSYNHNHNNNHNHSQYNGRYKFRNIQDNSNKYGTGSYSRHLSNIDNEDLRMKSFQLPDISERGVANLTIRNTMGRSFTKIKIDEYTEKKFNSMIEEELEKNILNPENLIKTANKLHDNVEKRYILKENK